MRSVTVLVLTTLAACAAERSANLNAALPIDSLFPRLTLVPLQSDTLGEIYGLAVLGGQVFAADPGRSRVSVFDLASGRLIREIGRSGDGPGEFRAPTKVIADAAGLVVLDQGRSLISRRTAGGDYLAEQAPGTWNSIAAVDGTDSVLLFGTPAALRADGDSTHVPTPVLHQYDRSGQVVRSYWRDPRPTDDWEAFFGSHFGCVDGAIAAGSSYRTNVVTLTDRRDGRQWEARVSAPWYEPVDWKADRLGKGEFFTTWAARHKLLNDVFCLGDGVFLAQFQAYQPDSARWFGYVVFDSSGHSGYSAPPGPSRLMSVVGDTLYGTTLLDDGRQAVELRLVPRWLRSRTNR